MMNRNIEHIANDVVPEFDRLLNEWLGSDMATESKEHRALSLFLWDNKVGLLRIAQYIINH